MKKIDDSYKGPLPYICRNCKYGYGVYPYDKPSGLYCVSDGIKPPKNAGAFTGWLRGRLISPLGTCDRYEKSKGKPPG